MRTLGIKIIDEGDGKHVCMDVKVLALVEQDDGSINEVDISTAVRGAYPRLEVGRVATATLEVFLTGFEARCEAEEILAKYVKPRKPSLWRKFRNVTTFGSRHGVQEYVR